MKNLLLAILVLLGSTSIAQTVTVKSSPEVTSTYPNSIWDGILGEDDNYYYLLRKEGSISNETILLEKIDKNSFEISSKDIKASSGTLGDSKLHAYTKMANGKLFVFLNGWNKAKKEGSFYVKELDLDGNAKTEDILLTTDPGKNILKSADYAVALSDDGSKVLVTTEPMFVKGAKEKLKFQVFNSSDFSELWSKELVFETEAERNPRHDIAVDNEGNAYVFKDRKISNKEYEFQLLVANSGGIKQVPVNLNGDYPVFYRMQFNQAGDLIMAGMLTKLGNSRTTWQNSWHLKANKSGVVVNKREALGEDLLGMIVNKKQAAKEGFKLQDFRMVNLLEKPNGGHILLAEQRRASKTSIPETTPPAYVHTVRYGGIVVMSFDAEGNRDWNTFYDKKQEIKTKDVAMDLGSFAYGIVNNKLNLVWNFTEIEYDLAHPYRHWFDASGARIRIDNIFGAEALYPTFLTSINIGDGSFNYTDRTFFSMPLADIQKPNSFKMAVDPSIFFMNEKGMVIFSRMGGEESKRHKFNTIIIE